MAYLLIDPQEKLDYTFNWSDFLDEGGSPSDTIDTSAWSIVPLNTGSPTEPVLSNDSKTANTATTFLQGGEFGRVYRLVNHVVTVAGRTSERSITLRCEQDI